jgi:RNA polymerase sigma-70 factor (ECF subfamily)
MDPEERFNAMFAESYGAVRRYARYRGLDAASSDDLVADVFTVAWKKLVRVPLDDPIPWLLAVARNHWRNHLRKRRRDFDLKSRLAQPTTAAMTPSAGGVDEVLRGLALLPSKDQELLRLIAWDQLTPQGAAVVLGCSPAAVRVRLHRARQRLARVLSQANGDRSRPPATRTPNKKEIEDVEPA